MYQFRDPIHGFIEITENERKIVNSMPFQRLRNIRQLATTYLVYHGAEHSRFGHSLGVMHLVTRVFDSVTKKTPKIFTDNPEENEAKTLWYRQILRLIGLTHDLGHGPFSHVSETLFEEGMGHEEYTKNIILKTEVGTYISEIGKDFQSIYGEQYEITPELIWMIYDGNDVLNQKFIMPDFMFLKSFMDGELDCDKMDYLLRDSVYCGVTYGKYDLERFISTLTIDKSEGQLRLAIEKGGVQALEEFILARYFMFIQVYFHKTRRYLDKCLVNCLQTILPNGKFPRETTEFLKWDDVLVLSLMTNSQEECILNFKNRIVMPCVYESQIHSRKIDATMCKAYLKVLKSECGETNLIDDHIDKAAHKLTPTLIARDDDSGKGIVIQDEKTFAVQNIMDVSLILDSIVAPINIDRIYAKKDIAEQATNIIRDLQS